MIWVPKKSVGDIYFGEKLDAIKKRHSLVRHKEWEEEISKTAAYQLAYHDLTIYINKFDEVDSITCSKRCEFNGENLIGMGIKDALLHMGYSPLTKPNDHVDLDWGEQDIYEFDDLGAQIWEFDGKVEEIICFDLDDDEE